MLLNETVYYEENPGVGECEMERADGSARSAYAVINQTCDWGLITYQVMESDQAAEDYVLRNQSPYAFPLPDYPEFSTDTLYGDDDVVGFIVAVGNVVVWGTTSETLVELSGIQLPGTSYIEAYSATLAKYGIERLLRIAGDPSVTPSGDTW